MALDWKEEFTELILARGEKYYKEGRVIHIKQEGNTVLAQVDGSETYNVEIDLPGAYPDYLECDCPYAETGEKCKHMAAVLFAIDAADFIFTDKMPAIELPPIVERVTVKEHWPDAIDTLPEKVLRSEMMKLCQKDHDLRHRLSVMYLKGLPDGQLNNWKADLQEIAHNYMDRCGKVNFADTWDFLWELNYFLEAKMVGLLDVGATMDAFYLAWFVMETALETRIDDVDDDLDRLRDSCEEIWKKAFEIATEEQHKQMHRWFWEHRNPEWSNGADDLDRFFLSLPWQGELRQRNIGRLKD